MICFCWATPAVGGGCDRERLWPTFPAEEVVYSNKIEAAICYDHIILERVRVHVAIVTIDFARLHYSMLIISDYFDHYSYSSDCQNNYFHYITGWSWGHFQEITELVFVSWCQFRLEGPHPPPPFKQTPVRCRRRFFSLVKCVFGVKISFLMKTVFF